MDKNDGRDAIRLAISRYLADNETADQFIPGTTPIPPSGKVVGEPEIQAMVEASLDAWLTTGRFNTEFEARLANYLETGRCITVNSGSSANLVAISSLFAAQLGQHALQAGDEIITVAAGFPTTVNPLIQNGGIPVFADVSLDTYNIDTSQLHAALSPKTRAIVLAHTLGNPFDLASVIRFCIEHNLYLVEDCCDALGARYTLPNELSAWHARPPTDADPSKWTQGTPAATRKVGSFGHIATLSFYPAHHITMGEGGAVFSRHPELMRIAESIRDWGRDCWCAPGRDNTCGKRFCSQHGQMPYGYDHKYIYTNLGYNLKITDMQAACALAQLDRLPGFIAQRQHNFAYLHARLTPLAEHLQLASPTPGSEPSWFGFPMTLRDAGDGTRLELLRYLEQYRIGTRLLFAGNLTRQPYFADRAFRTAGDLSNTDRAAENTFWVGVWPGLGEAHLDYVATKIENYFGVGF